MASGTLQLSQTNPAIVIFLAGSRPQGMVVRKLCSTFQWKRILCLSCSAPTGAFISGPMRLARLTRTAPGQDDLSTNGSLCPALCCAWRDAGELGGELLSFPSWVHPEPRGSFCTPFNTALELRAGGHHAGLSWISQGFINPQLPARGGFVTCGTEPNPCNGAASCCSRSERRRGSTRSSPASPPSAF